MKLIEKNEPIFNKLVEWSDNDFMKPHKPKTHLRYTELNWKQRMVVWWKVSFVLIAIAILGLLVGEIIWGILTMFWKISPALIILPFSTLLVVLAAATWIK